MKKKIDEIKVFFVECILFFGFQNCITRTRSPHFAASIALRLNIRLQEQHPHTQEEQIDICQ